MITSTLNLRRNDFEDRGKDDAGDDVGTLIDHLYFRAERKYYEKFSVALVDSIDFYCFPGKTTTLSLMGWTLRGKLRTQSFEEEKGSDTGGKLVR